MGESAQGNDTPEPAVIIPKPVSEGRGAGHEGDGCGEGQESDDGTEEVGGELHKGGHAEMESAGAADYGTMWAAPTAQEVPPLENAYYYGREIKRVSSCGTGTGMRASVQCLRRNFVFDSAMGSSNS